jgi:peptidoglycan/xylan/chitin deacetylase (PgdA/CDA1 family)
MTEGRLETVSFAVAAAAVLAISLVVDLRRGVPETSAGIPQFSGSAVVAEMPSVLPDPRLPARLRVTVVRDAAAASYYDSPATLDSIVEAWRVELAAIGADVRVVRSASLHAERAANVLVVPSSPCMTVSTREVIEAAASRGQGLVLTGLAGVHDAGCRRIGFGLIVAATGASRAEVLGPREMVNVVLPAGSPLAADLPPGARIELDPGGQVAVRHPGRDAYYADYDFQPEPAGGKPLLDGALVRATRGRGRVVYWGFELRDVVPRAWSRSVVRLLVRNSVAWAGRIPLAWVEPWPDGRPAAAAFAQDVEHRYPNARFALDSLRAAGVPGTYFLTSNYASHYSHLTRQLAAAGEVGTHSEKHLRLGGEPPDVQRARLSTSQRVLTRLLGSPVQGLRPPQEQFDSATMAAWLAAGGTYLLGANDARTAAPELLRIGADTLVLVSRVGRDDFALARSGAQHDTRRIATEFLNDLAQVRALGGLYVLSYHSQLLARPDMVPVLASVARGVAADSGVWAATTSDVATWWRARAALRIETRARGADAIEVIVHNGGAEPLSGAVARIVLPDSRRALDAGAPLLSSDPDVVRLALPPLPASSSQSFTVRLGPSGVATSGRARP